MQSFTVACKVWELPQVLRQIQALQEQEEPRFIPIADEDDELYWFNPFNN